VIRPTCPPKTTDAPPRHEAGRRPTARLSFHARLRCKEMGLGTKAVKAVVATPELDTPSWGGRRVLTAGALAVVYNPGANEVITVLWAQAESRAAGPVRRAAG
jgi:hypothetical protein